MDEDFRNQIYNTLIQKETDDLIEIWQTNDQTAWSPEVFPIIQGILESRLEKLPIQNLPIYESDDNDEISYFDKQIEIYFNNKNIDNLVNILNNDPDPILRLEAAEALAKLNDERGLDYLIEALEFDDANISLDAEEILSELNAPKGVLALHTHLLNNKRTIYHNKHLGEKSFITAYVSTIVFGFAISLFFYLVSIPRLPEILLNLIADYYIFKYVVKSQLIAK